MTSDRIEQLIVDLAGEATPVRRVASVPARMAVWLAVAAVSAAVGVWAFGPRHDAWQALATAGVLRSLVPTLVTAVSAGAVALALSVPDADRAPWARWMPPAAALLWFAVLLGSVVAAAGGLSALGSEPFHPPCGIQVAALSVVPTLALLRGARMGFVLDRIWVGAFAILGGGAFAAAAVQLLCPIDRPAHLVVSHALPAVVLLLATPLAARLARR